MQHEVPKTKWKSTGNQGWEKSNLNGAGYEEAMASMKLMGLTERKPVIAGNWKMNKTKAETREFVEAFKAMDLDEGVEKILIAPYTDLDTLVEGLAGTDIGAGARTALRGAALSRARCLWTC